jgi:Na+/melibiose symporter-like transporter
MIVTCKKEIPSRWIAFTILPWASFSFNFAVVGAAFVFSLKKFAENPAGLTFVLSLPGFIAIIAAPFASFLSDRIWTRYGRRKPFVIAGSVGMVTALVLMPLMPNLWALIWSYLLYHVSDAFSSPRDPLKQEVVPPAERGRATGAMTWCQNLASVAFYSVMLGRFDDVRYFAGIPLHGENIIYWSAALLLAMMLALIALGIKEVDQKSPLCGQRLSARNLVGGLLDRELWPVYLLVVSFGLLNFFSGFGPFLSTLLYTDQWGYTKQEMGTNVAIGGIVNVFIIGFLTFFADRLPRMRAFRTFICLSLAWNAFYFCYVNFVLPDKRPSLIEIIIFGEVLSIISILLNLVYIPLIYDYVRRNKMGTFSAGFQIATRGIQLITLNGVGLFVWAYAVLFQPPAGEMTRVVLREATDKASLVATLRSTLWRFPQDETMVPAAAITASSWQADGIFPDQSRVWEIRLQNKDSEKLAGEKKQLERDRSPLLAEAKRMRDEAAVVRGKGQGESATQIEERASAQQTESDRLSVRIVRLEEELAVRAGNLGRQVSNLLRDRIVSEGDQLLEAMVSPALVVEIGCAERPDQRKIEKMIEALRHDFPALIDLRPLKRETGYGLTVSALWPAGIGEKEFANQTQAAVKERAAALAPELFVGAAPSLSIRTESAVTLTFQVVEQPVVTYLSPVNRAIKGVVAWFGVSSSPTYRLASIARNLRLVDETNHVRVIAGSRDRTISVTTFLQPAAVRAADATDPLGEKLTAKLGGELSGDRLLQIRAFCSRFEKATATQRLTVVHPLLTASYAPLRYDYMSGYIWVFFVGLIGIGLTFVFSRLERKGVIHKRGVEEAEAS